MQEISKDKRKVVHCDTYILAPISITKKRNTKSISTMDNVCKFRIRRLKNMRELRDYFYEDYANESIHKGKYIYQPRMRFVLGEQYTFNADGSKSTEEIAYAIVEWYNTGKEATTNETNDAIREMPNNTDH